MKKKVLLIITIIISMVLFMDRVEAAAELTCVYKAGTPLVGQKATKIVQYSDGTKKAFINSKRREPKADDDAWFHAEYASFKSDEELQSCPKFIDYSGRAVITFREEEKNGFTELIQEENGVEDKHQITKDEDYNAGEISDPDGEVASGKWLMGCQYKRINTDDDYLYLYFNKEKVKVVVGNVVVPSFEGSQVVSPYQVYSNIKVSSLLDRYNSNKGCPINIYSVKRSQSGGVSTSSGETIYSLSGKANADTYLYVKQLTGKTNNSNVKIDDCTKLFGDDFISLMDEIMKWIRIFVPILLIGFGILDFTKATFSSSDENMKKSREKFFKRVAAAVLVFLAPIFVKLILNLANSAWSWINPGTCIE